MKEKVLRVLEQGGAREITDCLTDILAHPVADAFEIQDWIVLGELGAQMNRQTKILSPGYEESDLEYLKLNLIGHLTGLGLLNSDPQKRWAAWLASWQYDKMRASAILCAPDQKFGAWQKGEVRWPARMILNEASRFWHKKIYLVPTDKNDLKPFLNSTESYERELGIRLLAEIGYAAGRDGEVT